MIDKALCRGIYFSSVDSVSAACRAGRMLAVRMVLPKCLAQALSAASVFTGSQLEPQRICLLQASPGRRRLQTFG